ncbi:thioredoxin domain-containing protein [Sphingomonas arenae]|uniref:thioredoxin domain-containing protein n=1 Tax=Sphingomonas arenae TaxID=2812555 RepID=UPI001967B97F|nr:thioredoxin domain-containing protein [Sphingomonas arenae]
MIKKLSLLAAAAALSACGGGDGNTLNATNDAPITPVAAPNGGDWTQMVTQTPEGGMLMGNPDAKVKVIEFASMTCPHCAEFSAKGEPQLVDKYVKTGQVSYEFRNFVRDPLDLTMSLVARCAGPNPTFFKLTSQLFADQKAVFERVQAIPADQQQALQTLPAGQQFQKMAEFAGLPAWAAQRGLPSAKTSACLSDQATVDRLVQMTSDGTSQYNLTGTPSFVINGQLAEQTATWETLEPAIREALGG